MHDNDTPKAQTQDPKPPARRWLFGVWLAGLFVLAILVGRWVSTPSSPHAPAPVAAAPEAAPKAVPDPIPAATVRIAGRVLGAAGAPLSGASVTAKTASLPNALETTSDDAGDWSLELKDVPSGSLWELKFHARDHVTEVLAGYSPAAEPLVVELRAGGGISGRITVDEGPAAQAKVHIAGPGLWPPVSVTADAEGRFVTPPVPEGRYEVLARTASHGTVATLDHDGKPSAAPIEIPLLLAGTLKVTVQGPPKSLVTIAGDRVHVLSLAAWTQDGTAVFEGLPPGVWTVRVRAPGHQEKIQSIRTTAAPAELVITPDRAATVIGRVVNEAGKPIELAQLVAHTTTVNGGQWLLRRDPTGSIQSRGTPQGGGSPSAAAAFGWFTDETGAFELSGLPAGSVVIEARQPGYQPSYAGPFTVTSGAVVRDVQLTLRPGLTLSVRVEGPVGPLAVARVEIAPAAAPKADGTLPVAFAGGTRELVTGENGMATAAGLPQLVTVRAWADGHVETSQTIDIASLKGEPLVLLLTSPGATTRGRVLLGGQLPLPGVALQRVVPPGEPLSMTACRAVTDGNGRFELVGCPEGKVWLSVVPEPERAAAVVAQVTTGEDVELRVEAAVKLQLRVRGDNGAPVPRARIDLAPGRKTPSWRRPPMGGVTTTDDAGNAYLAGLPAGPLAFRVRARGFQDLTQTIQLTEAMDPVTIAIKPTIQLRGAVIDRYGATVGSARVRVGKFTTSTGPDGRFEVDLTGNGEVDVEAIHLVLGRGQGRWKPGDEPMRIELNAATIDVPRWGPSLRAAGLTLWEDGARVVVEDVDERAHAVGARRGDVLIGAAPKGDAVALEADRAGKTVRYQVR